jgi:hypothetical protein
LGLAEEKKNRMQFPLSLWDLSMWLAIMATILLIIVELTSAYYLRRFTLNKRRLKYAASVIGILFLVTVMIRMVMSFL